MSCPNCGYQGLSYPFYTVVSPVRDYPGLSKSEQVQSLSQRQHHGADFILMHTQNKTYVVKNRYGPSDRLPSRVIS
jgi:hypothetical protein